MTKDRWSLRLNTSFVLDNVRLDSLSFSMAEGNLFGRNKPFAFEFALDPGAMRWAPATTIRAS